MNRRKQANQYVVIGPDPGQVWGTFPTELEAWQFQLWLKDRKTVKWSTIERLNPDL